MCICEHWPKAESYTHVRLTNACVCKCLCVMTEGDCPVMSVHVCMSYLRLGKKRFNARSTRSRLDDDAEGCVGGMQAASRLRTVTSAGPEAIAGSAQRFLVAVAALEK